MDRKSFLQSLLLLPLTGAAMNLHEFQKSSSEFKPTDKMPVLFYGHGSPMNAIEQNNFTKGWKNSIKNLPTPSAILCISAHWETRGTFVTAMNQPRTIHDFGGFPPELFATQYPADGSSELASETKKIVKQADVGLDHDWGLDHGCWSVLKHLYPEANIPVVQLSLDRTKPANYHYELAKELATLRKKGILIIGSGNIVHNLGKVDWSKQDSGFDWADEANSEMKNLINKREHQKLVEYKSLGIEFQLSIPTPEHYLPLLYTLGLQTKDEQLEYFNDKTVMGSIAMTSLKIG